MSTMTFEDLRAHAIDTRTLPPMEFGGRNTVRKGDRKRSGNAKRETLARRQARALKVGV